FLASEKAVVALDPARVGLADLRAAVRASGYSVPEPAPEAAAASPAAYQDFARRVLGLLGLVFAAVVGVVVLGEWLGWLEALTDRVPFVVGVGIVLLAGWPIFLNVARAALRRQVIAHTLMTL